MKQEDNRDAAVSSDIVAVSRAFVAALSAVKLYPQNNPVYAQSIQKSYAILSTCLAAGNQCRLEVRKTTFAYGGTPLDSDARLHRSIISDLYEKGIREITFQHGLAETEFTEFLILLNRSYEHHTEAEGLESVLWEKNFSHIQVKMASLGAVVREDKSDASSDAETRTTVPYEAKDLEGKTIDVFGTTIALADIVGAPVRFGALMLEQAKEASGSFSGQITRLLELYREARNQLLGKQENQEVVFKAMAESILSMEPNYRDSLIGKELFGEYDQQLLSSIPDDSSEQVLSDTYELLSSRFVRSWTVPQVSTLLLKTYGVRAPAEAAGKQQKISSDLYVIAREMAEYTPDEMESIKAISDFGKEPDILEAVVRTLIYILPMVQDPSISEDEDNRVIRFSDVVGQLEQVLFLLLEKRDYVLSSLVLRAFRIPVAPLFKPRIAEALARAGDKKIILQLMGDIRRFPDNSAEYHAIHLYLSLLNREATPVLLQMLAEETDLPSRKILIRILKDLGKNQIAMLGERLSDERWYFVRNIVSILGESRKEEAISYLEKVATHKNFQIRQEVLRALIMIGGRRVIDLLIRFLKDADIDIRFMALRGLGSLSLADDKIEHALIAFLKGAWIKSAGPELKLEAIASLGKVGRQQAIRFLKRFTKTRWWLPRNRQAETMTAAGNAISEIERRIGHAGTD